MSPPRLDLEALERADFEELNARLEADAERVATFERMDADRTDRPGMWPTLHPDLEEPPA